MRKNVFMNVNEIKIMLITLADARYSLHYFLIFLFNSCERGLLYTEQNNTESSHENINAIIYIISNLGVYILATIFTRKQRTYDLLAAAAIVLLNSFSFVSKLSFTHI